MYLATITFFEPNENTNTEEYLAIAPSIQEMNDKIQKIRTFIENKGFRFLSSIIEEIHGVRDEASFLTDFQDKSGKVSH